MRKAWGKCVTPSDYVFQKNGTALYHVVAQGSVYYSITIRYYNTLMRVAKVDGSYIKELAPIEHQHQLVIDDIGLQPLDTQSRSRLVEIMDDLHCRSASTFKSQVPLSSKHEVIDEQTSADAILFEDCSR